MNTIPKLLKVVRVAETLIYTEMYSMHSNSFGLISAGSEGSLWLVDLLTNRKHKIAVSDRSHYRENVGVNDFQIDIKQRKIYATTYDGKFISVNI